MRIKPSERGSRIGIPLEYGANDLIEKLGSDIRENLAEIFGEKEGNAIMAIAKIGVTEKESEKRLVNAYRCSYESMRYPDLSLSPSSVSRLTKEIGLSRDLQLRFFHRYVDGSTHLIFDGTRLVCFSKDIDMARIGYNHSMIADPQINLMYCFSLRPAEMPVYFMPFVGNKPDISDIMTSINEFGLKDATLICDKGFYSEGNLDEMRKGGPRLITPLKRNSDDIDRPFLWGNKGSVLPYEGLFSYHERTIYYHVCQKFGKAEIQKRSHKEGNQRATDLNSPRPGRISSCFTSTAP